MGVGALFGLYLPTALLVRLDLEYDFDELEYDFDEPEYDLDEPLELERYAIFSSFDYSSYFKYA